MRGAERLLYNLYFAMKKSRTSAMITNIILLTAHWKISSTYSSSRTNRKLLSTFSSQVLSLFPLEPFIDLVTHLLVDFLFRWRHHKFMVSIDIYFCTCSVILVEVPMYVLSVCFFRTREKDSSCFVSEWIVIISKYTTLNQMGSCTEQKILITHE